jgi:hypothetical protein
MGLNNPAHLNWALKRVRLSQEQKNLGFFFDYGLYLSNRLTYRFFSDLLGESLKGGLPWVEEEGRSSWLPLFIGRTCLIKESKGGHCPQSCNHRAVHRLQQGKKRLKLVVEDCLNYLFREA